MNAPPPPTTFGRYEIVRTLGRGAMGVVYEGRDPKLERQVAIKTILKSHLLDSTVADDYSARFVREAQAVARLAHPNIVTVFDFGEQDEVAYLVMEFIHGRELAAHFEAGDYLGLPRAVAVMGELLGALGYAHERGIVHRDIKPANVMIDAAGRVKLTDFGVARLADAGSERTMAGTMVGTPSYMSPEQVQGLAVGSRADLFAAGVILYQFLTHRKPFGGSGSFSIQQAIVHEHPPAPSTLDPSLPVAFDAVVARALAKNPADRYASAADFARDLLAALPASTLPPTPVHAPAADPEATIVRPRTVAPGRPDTVTQARPAATTRTLPLPSRAPAPAQPAAVPATGAQRIVWLTGLGVLAFAATGAFLWLRPAAVPTAAPTAAPSAMPAQGTDSAPVVVAPPATAAPSIAATAPAPASAPAAAPAVVSAPPPAPRPPREEPRRAPAPAEPATEPSTGTARAAAIREAASRCATLLQRLQLGDTLSARETEILRKECNR